MSHDIAPAIRTRYDERYNEIEQIAQIGSDVRFHRGLGESGTKVLLMDCSAIGGCPRCSEDKMVLSLNVYPTDYDDAVFYCTNIACPHFVGDEVEYDMDRIRADTPHVWDNTAECPYCGKRHTVEVERNSMKHEECKEGSSYIVTSVCDDCVDRITDDGGVEA